MRATESYCECTYIFMSYFTRSLDSSLINDSRPKLKITVFWDDMCCLV
jgi:hypothetical protein